MCGIAGFIDAQLSNTNAERLIDAMCQVIRHRGPDDQGIWVGDGVALGMRRLSIIDLSNGHQPMFNEDESILVVFNGEIYNYRELQKELQELGHRFHTNSDAEIIPHAYEEFGDACVQHFRGMFTFALWDKNRQRLLAARDRFGKKPLNYYWDGQRLFFGSEIKSLLETSLKREINHQALDEYLLYRYVPAPHTLFKNIFKLPAAHLLIYEHEQVRTQRYWTLPFVSTSHDDEETAVERIQILLKEAVRLRLQSDVPLGAFLSGGIDSSIIVGLMSQMISQPVKTFSIGFEEDDYSELPYARRVAKHFSTDHQEFIVRPDLISILPQLVWAYDEPFADPSMLPMYYVSKLASEHVSVVLSGDGGDELFAGYTRYKRELSVSRIPEMVRFFLRWGSQFLPNGVRGKNRLYKMGGDLATRYIQDTMPFAIGGREYMYDAEYFTQIRNDNPFERLRSEFRFVSHLDVVSQMQYVDIQTYLVDDILVKVDKASMFNSIETRAPFLDHHLAEYVSSLPSSLRMNAGVLKYLLKKAATGLLPTEILTRRKQGFGVPIEHWFRGELTSYAQEVLTSSQAQQRGIFNQHFVQHLLRSHANSQSVNHSDAIWTLLCLELWFQIYMDRPLAYNSEKILKRNA